VRFQLSRTYTGDSAGFRACFVCPSADGGGRNSCVSLAWSFDMQPDCSPTDASDCPTSDERLSFFDELDVDGYPGRAGAWA